MKKYFKYLIGILISTLLLAPLVSYIYKFGFCILEKPEGWANFGTAMSGIYSPIIAFLAFLILVGQAKLQGKINKHQFDQTYISQTLSDLNFYLDLLGKELDHKTDEHNTVRHELQSVFSFLDKNSVNKDDVKEFAKGFHSKYRKIFDYWGAIYPLLIGLDSQKEYPYEHNFVSIQHRIISVLSLQTCVALDQFYSCVSENRVIETYYFWEK